MFLEGGNTICQKGRSGGRLKVENACLVINEICSSQKVLRRDDKSFSNHLIEYQQSNGNRFFTISSIRLTTFKKRKQRGRVSSSSEWCIGHCNVCRWISAEMKKKFLEAEEHYLPKRKKSGDRLKLENACRGINGICSSQKVLWKDDRSFSNHLIKCRRERRVLGALFAEKGSKSGERLKVENACLVMNGICSSQNVLLEG
ncbi:hypothetical protein CEXT_782351 [Caerostris extrusa]|uniref:HNH homing endonuclease n=1 Tax=Caerostris extrusa TaxID=172846 RepID=A0AAV4MGS5_CAEEX|nr:hypothetical protein CEXT_782351 [Caerostris extrusa]